MQNTYTSYNEPNMRCWLIVKKKCDFTSRLKFLEFNDNTLGSEWQNKMLAEQNNLDSIGPFNKINHVNANAINVHSVINVCVPCMCAYVLNRIQINAM